MFGFGKVNANEIAAVVDRANQTIQMIAKVATPYAGTQYEPMIVAMYNDAVAIADKKRFSKNDVIEANVCLAAINEIIITELV